MGTLDIKVSREHRQLVFSLCSSDGRPPRVHGVVIWDRERERACWRLMPAVLSGKVDTARELAERLSAAGLSVPPGIDPIEDLAPTDPRYRIAEHHMLDVVARGIIELTTLIYGVVPPGFGQVIPEEGGAVALEGGHSYEIEVSGQENGSLVFAAL